MSINDDFYSHFPSLNSNSKENQRYKRITQDYTDFLKNNLKFDSPKPTKQQKGRRSREKISESFSSDASSPSMDVIFSAEERNRFENEQKEERRIAYQKTLQLQIEEQKLKRQKELDRQKREEMILEQRLQRQIENMRLQKDPLADKIVERISLSEEEDESHKNNNLSNHNTSSYSNNNVYRYFSHSAKIDSKLFNYRNLYRDIAVDPDESKHEYLSSIKPAKSNAVALKNPAAKNLAKIDKCRCMNTRCSRCHKKLEMFCKECEDADMMISPANNQLEIEYIEPRVSSTPDQQVVVYRASDQNTPYSFNIDPNSQFYKETLEGVRDYNEEKLANYIKLYGDLRKKNVDNKMIIEPSKGVIPKRKPFKENVSEKNIANNASDIDDILNNAQLTVITQIGFAKKQLEIDKLNY